jgi:transcriptional regulator with XRE-family HTH domain
MTGEQLGDLRVQLGLTQHQLAVLLVVERRTVIRWEAGTLPIPDRSLFWLAPLLLYSDLPRESRCNLGEKLSLQGPLWLWWFVLSHAVVQAEKRRGAP